MNTTQAPNLRILIYSGDVDIATCPFAYAQLCLGELNRALKKQWSPWQIPDAPKQVRRMAFATHVGLLIFFTSHPTPSARPRAQTAGFVEVSVRCGAVW